MRTFNKKNQILAKKWALILRCPIFYPSFFVVAFFRMTRNSRDSHETESVYSRFFSFRTKKGNKLTQINEAAKKAAFKKALFQKRQL